MQKPGQPDPKILGPLKKRLSWEVTMEFGFNARVGRTLDKVRCSTARLDEGTAHGGGGQAAHDADQRVRPTEPRCTPARLRHFVVGLLTRTKIRGGVSHELLRGYAAKQGQRYFLSKDMNPLHVALRAAQPVAPLPVRPAQRERLRLGHHLGQPPQLVHRLGAEVPARRP